jgi:hypothetical protein
VAKQQRQARVRPEYAAWYPTVQVATWLPAQSVARAVERQLLGESSRNSLGPRWVPGARLLDPRHFLFRGGVPRDPSSGTRRGDSEQARTSAPPSASPAP